MVQPETQRHFAFTFKLGKKGNNESKKKNKCFLENEEITEYEKLAKLNANVNLYYT